MAMTNGLGLQVLLSVVGAWLVAALLARIGIPRVDPAGEALPRPLETLGAIAICLPASLHASLLKDGSAWLSVVSPRSPRRLRLAWLSVVVGFGSCGAAAWIVTLPIGVPRAHFFALWLLVMSFAVGSVVSIRHDLAVVLPFLLVVVFSLGVVIPFRYNVIYNVERTPDLLLAAGIALAAATMAFTQVGDRRDRKDS